VSRESWLRERERCNTVENGIVVVVVVENGILGQVFIFCNV